MLSRKCEHITPLLFELHWLPVKQRIIFKILLFTYKIVNGIAPAYLSDLIQSYRPARALRSADKFLLCQPKHRLQTYGARSFSVCAPKMWNELPIDIRKASSVSSFKSKLKTYLFCIAFE